MEKGVLISQGAPSEVPLGYWQVGTERASSPIFPGQRLCEGNGGAGGWDQMAEDPETQDQEFGLYRQEGVTKTC